MVGEGLQEHWRSIGGALEEHWRAGGGSEEGWRRIGEGLEEDGPPKYGLGTPQYGLGTPQYGDYVATSWKNDIFLPKLCFFDNFSFRALKLLANHEEQLLTFFGFLPPYFGVSRSLA